MKTKQGSGLIFAVVLLFVILGMVITLSSITVLETKMSQKTKSSIGAFYGAESGVEWALNKIATSTATNITGVFGAPGSGVSPVGADYKVYLLDKDGKVIINGALDPSEIKAVRSVGTQGGETQRAIEAAVASTDLPTGAVMFFNLAACPTGWTELIAGRGRYIVGTPSGGTNAAIVGTALSNTENRPTGQHSHGGVLVRGGSDIPEYSGGYSSPGNTGGVTGGAVAGTNAPYIQLLACQKS